jgi:hypothetical protein
LLLDIGLPLLFSYHYLSRRISGKKALILFSLFLVFYVVVERGRTGSERTIGEFLYTLKSSINQQKLSLVEPAARMGLAIRIVTREVDLVPEKEDYFWGSTFVWSAIMSIPLLGSKIVPAWYETPDRWLAKL